MSYSTLQKDLERITLEKDLDQALNRMVDFEEEVNRNNEEEEEEDIKEEENTNDFAQLVGSYLFGVALGCSITKILSYINGRGKNNQR